MKYQHKRFLAVPWYTKSDIVQAFNKLNKKIETSGPALIAVELEQTLNTAQ